MRRSPFLLVLHIIVSVVVFGIAYLIIRPATSTSCAELGALANVVGLVAAEMLYAASSGRVDEF